jgi:hypothetical protein
MDTTTKDMQGSDLGLKKPPHNTPTTSAKWNSCRGPLCFVISKEDAVFNSLGKRICMNYYLHELLFA